jgi:hypothetical protein
LSGSRTAGIVVVLIATCGVLASAAGPAAAKPASGEVTIHSRPGGVFGTVSSDAPGRCAAKRRIVVFRQTGKGPAPRRDERIAATRSSASAAGYEWSLDTQEVGPLYAVATGEPGCAPVLSAAVRSQPIGQPVSAAERTDYAPCGPYTSEGFSRICRFEKLHLELREQSVGTPCRIGNASGECRGEVTAGLFPWATSGTDEGVTVRFVWSPTADAKAIKIYVLGKAHPDTILAGLSGTVPDAGSPRFSISEGYAQNEKGFPSGDYFYTPDLPGQAAGEPGGPLGINFQSKGIGATVDVSGYLYLRP